MTETKLATANKQLALQNVEKEKRAAELSITKKKLAFEIAEKGKRAAELGVAIIELAFQVEEKGKRAAELIIANKELAFEIAEKGKRAAELNIANKELVYQNKEKDKRAEELIIANIELAYQNEEKEKRAEELIIANKELAFENKEKEKRAAELNIANIELVYQNEEKEKRAEELITSTKLHFTQRKKDDEYMGHLAAIVESSVDAIISKSLDGIIKSWNKGGEKMFGYTADEAVGKHISLIIPPEYKNEEKTIIERIRNNEIIEHYETVRTKKSGEQFYVSLTVSPLKDRAGSIIGASKIARDISSRKKSEAELIHTNKKIASQNEEKKKRAAELGIANKELVEKAKAEEALRKSEEKYRTLFTSIDQGFALCELIRNKEGKAIDFYVLEVNPTFEKQSGVSMEMVLGKSILQVFPEFDKWWIETYASVVDDQTPVIFEKYFEITHRWFGVNVYPVLKERFAVLFSDITDRKLAEKKLKETDIIFKSIPDALISSDLTGRITSWNEVAEVLYGFSKEEMIGQIMPDVILTEFLNKKQENWQEIFAHQGYWKGEVIQTCKDGKKIYVSSAAHVIQNSNGENSGYVAVNRDVTSQKEADIKIIESEKQLRKLSTKLEQKVQQRTTQLVEKNTELVNMNNEKEKRAAELSIANKELAFQNKEKEKRAAELSIANKELAFQNKEKEKRAAELSIANNELVFQNGQKEKRAEELVVANKELAYQYEVKEKRAAELVVANEELFFQNDEKEKRAAELNIANIELAYQNDEKEKRAAELSIANKELAFQNEEKEKRAAELSTVNKELAYQNKEKEIRAAELSIANKELAFQNEQKEKRAEELIVANKELAFQNEVKEKRAAELIIANEELAFQNHEKEKRAAELNIANIELAYQNDEKEKRAQELSIANKELAFQSDEKEKRAAELIIANRELLFQNEEKEKRAAELIITNKELESFAYISSHDLQEPLRKIQIFSTRLIADESPNLSDKGKDYILRMQDASNRMQSLIIDLLAYSRTTASERKFKTTDFKTIIEEVIKDFKETIEEKNATIDVAEICDVHIIPFQFRQLMHNLIGNALKFSNPDIPLRIIIKSRNIKYSEVKANKLLPEKDYCHITITDNGIGFEPQYKDYIFEIFKRLHDTGKIPGTGIGLTIAKKIVENHKGIIRATSKLGKGAAFDIYIPST